MRRALILVLAAACTAPAAVASPTPGVTSCPATSGRPARDARPAARARMGEGFRVSGVVRSDDCRPVPGARVYVWLANQQGIYDAAHEGTVTADAQGRYSFESSVPGGYDNVSPHIHIAADADGHEAIELEILPRPGDTSASQEFVLRRRKG